MKIRDIKIVTWPYVRKHDDKTAAFLVAGDIRIIMAPKFMRDLAKKLLAAADRIDKARAKDA